MTEYNIKLEEGEVKGLGIYVAQSKGDNFLTRQFALEVVKNIIGQYKEQGGK